MNTAKMSAFALRAIMGEAFDDNAYERGRQDARKFFREHPEERESKIEEVKQRLESRRVPAQPRAVLLDWLPLRS